MLKKIAIWTISSSKDPSKYSMTFIGLAAFVPTALALVKVFGVDGLSEEDIKPLLTDLDGGVVALLAAVSALTVFWGSLRKIYYRLWQLRQKFFE